ncbi:MAG: tRNA (guanosine(37)-N1)-methyltransferase TrmD [Fimbriimonadaceae bacterium]|nr:MAG: tRNA (guanosine(37)-N1)-methyltransferase TrmD [Fimbriimonadaceae bacterium]
MIRFDVVTLFPQMIHSVLGESILQRAQAADLIQVGTACPRDFADDARKTVDDKPIGGGAGMVMLPEPIDRAIRSCGPSPEAAVVFLDPRGRPFTQSVASELALKDHIVLVCGRYEGIDQRVVDKWATHVLSVGDYVLTGGELPALIVIDAVSRLVDGVLGSPESLLQDTHSDGLLSAPQYSGPREFEGRSVPEVLYSGNHEAVRLWRRRQSLILTRSERPDLFCRAPIAKGDLDMLSS